MFVKCLYAEFAIVIIGDTIPTNSNVEGLCKLPVYVIFIRTM